MTVNVWSERRAGGWDQCSECGYLMGLLHGGLTKFPLGAYTGAERDALTATEIGRTAARAAGLPMFPLIDYASLVRYKMRLRSVSGNDKVRATDAQLRTALSQPGNAVVLPGTYQGLPYNHPLRERARIANGRDYTAGHMVTVIGGTFWLDPLRPMNEPGYPCTVADAMAFAYANSDAHVIGLNELTAQLPDTALEEEMIDPARHKPVASAIFKAGAVYKDPDRASGTYGTVLSNSRVQVYALPRETVQADGKATLVPILIDLLSGPATQFAIGWAGVDQLDPTSWQPLGWTAPSADCTDQVAVATAAGFNDAKAKASAAVAAIKP